MTAFSLPAPSGADADEADTSATGNHGDAAERHWGQIPEGLDILVTHGPPSGVGDLHAESGGGGPPCHAGCPVLREHVRRARPTLHLFGHMHEGFGAYLDDDSGVVHVNAASCTDRYLPLRPPIVVDMVLPTSADYKGRGGNGVVVTGLDDQSPHIWLAPRPVPEQPPQDENPPARSGGGGGTYGPLGKPDITASHPFFRRLVGELHGHPALHDASGTSAYRNKASYLLGRHGFPGENPMCDPALNAVAQRCQSLALEVEAASSEERWVECALKLTRRGEVGVKLVIRGLKPPPQPSVSLEAAPRAEKTPPPWLDALLADFGPIGVHVCSVCVQPCPEDSESAKPVRNPWMPGYVMPVAVYGEPYVVERAPAPAPGVPGVEFRLSPDAFSEVNSSAEDAMFSHILEWARQLRPTCPRLSLLGRNHGFTGLALQREVRFDEVLGCTHCWQTLADTNASVGWHAGSPWLPGGSTTFRTRKIDKSGFAEEILALAGGPPTVVHVTNSRHGLPQGVPAALLATQEVRAILYNSCAHAPLAAEWSLFCSEGGFEIAQFASSDLLAGTEYDSAVFLMVRRPRTLVMPIGPPAFGKTATWHRVNGVEDDTCTSAADGGFGVNVMEVFERDKRFALERAGPGGLRGARARCHAALLGALGSARQRVGGVFYLDSTNGQRGARLAYRDALQPSRTIFCLLGQEGDDSEGGLPSVDLVLDRVLARCRRGPGLPAHERRQWEDAARTGLRPKLERLMCDMELLNTDELQPRHRSSCDGDACDEADEKVLILRSIGAIGDVAEDCSIGGVASLPWQLFLEICCPALARVGSRRQNDPVAPGVGVVTSPSSIDREVTHDCCKPEVGLGTTIGEHGRVALLFLTSAQRASAPTAEGEALWNLAAWQELVEDFEQRRCRFGAAFQLFRHDDSAAVVAAPSPPAETILSRAQLVTTVPTKRAGLSLVVAELRLIRAALAAGCDRFLLLSGSCLPLMRLDALHEALVATDKSWLQYHFMKGGQQRQLGVPLGALQWKIWHRREAEVLARIDESDLVKRWAALEATMCRSNVAPDEVVLVNELQERVGPLESCCERRAVTFCEWAADEKAEGPLRARVFSEVPAAAWEARALACRKLALDEAGLRAWRESLTLC
eukprot:TRINITY_DN34359_c0_g2_i1.p1 TRINITY_DN34359_c0_g2~~TRINITY_DN34359_c0_g2_i1.p1  ORF type:complete len:1252 (+),score=207.91 TRINITY_DN34359_c0_g2_i1:350-3757(+)